MTSPLCTYLHDHHAGSVVIGEMLAKALADPGPHRQFLAQLSREIAAERDQLETLCEKFGPRESLAKRAAAWTTEKFARFKVGASDDPLRHLEFLDLLLTGVRGKLGLWEVLAGEATSRHPHFAALDLPMLIAAAETQIEGITRCRLETFAELLHAEAPASGQQS